MFPGWPNKQEGGGWGDRSKKEQRDLEYTSLCCFALLLVMSLKIHKCQSTWYFLLFFSYILLRVATVLKRCWLWLWGVFKLIIVLRWTEFSTFVLQAIRLSLEQALPPEPSENSGKQISKLRIRTPSGEFLERRFLGSCNLQVLFDFVASKGYPFEEFKLLTTFPRRNVSSHSL